MSINFCAPDDCDCIYGKGTSQAATCKQLLKQGPGVHVGVDTSAVSDAANALFKSFIQPVLDALPGYGLKIGLFMLALMLLIVGLWVLGQPQGEKKV